MNRIISKRFFSDNVAEIVVEAPLIAKSRRAGHFVIVRVDNNSERMPLTISNADTAAGTITLVVQRIGVSSAKLCAMNPGECLADIVGPLGQATRIENYGTVVCACGGVGAAPMLPIAQALKRAGNRVITILAARNKDLVILHDELAATSDENAKRSLEQLPKLRGCQVHTSVMLSEVDIKIFKKLGVDLTSDPVHSNKRRY